MTRRDAPVSPPVVLTIAGSDSGGGAGIQADLKTIEACGGFGTSAITSVTAQNTTGVQGSHLLPLEDIEAQIEAVCADFDVAAVKTGMLATGEVIDLVVDHAADLPALVVDPVMVAASGDRLLAEEAETAYEALVAESTLVTPNADEAEVLTGVAVEDEDSAVQAGRMLVEEQGADAALVKGGHVPGDHVVDTLVTDDETGTATESAVTTFRHDRVDTDATHGSGCTLSSAIATHLAHGDDLKTAVGRGIDLLTRAVRYNVDVGNGPGSVHHLVELRNDASRAATVDRLHVLVDWVRGSGWDGLVPTGGLGLAAATPHAEAPGDVAAVAGRLEDAAVARTATAEDERRDRERTGVHFDADHPLGSLLLAAREAEPELRFAALVDADRDDLADLQGSVVTVDGSEAAAPAGDEAADASETLSAAVLAPVSEAENPVAVSLPDDAGTESDEKTEEAAVFGTTTSQLLDRLEHLADAR